jgi:uncharacterized protein YrrD
MLRNIKELFGYAVRARDGELGKVKDAYFDDQRFGIRHLVIDTGGWLGGRKVLISPRSVRGVDWDAEAIDVDLTKQQVKESPGIDTDMPVSRQNEIDYHRYYGYPNYWEGANLWGTTMLPYPWVGTSTDPMVPPAMPVDPTVAHEMQGRINEELEHADVHLRSCDEVAGYEIMANDGTIGEVDDFVFDDRSFAIRDIVVDTRKWLPGKHVLVAIDDIDHVSYDEHEVYVKVSRGAIENAPEYDPSQPVRESDVARGMGAAPTP